MTRSKLNFGIDVVAFVAFLFLLSTGVLLQYQLPFGSGGITGRGTGRGAATREIVSLWGLTRHDWGQIHYWIAGALVAVLALHVIFHWKWIVCVLRGAHSEASGFRFGIGLASLVGFVLLAAMPLISGTRQTTRGELRQAQEPAAEAAPEQAQAEESPELRGSMTLAEVAEGMKTPVADVLQKLGLPADTASDERMGRLVRRHGMEMSEARRRLQEPTAGRDFPTVRQ